MIHHQLCGGDTIITVDHNWWYSVLCSETTTTLDIIITVLVVFLHSTGYPSQYWWYPLRALMICLHSTEDTPSYLTEHPPQHCRRFPQNNTVLFFQFVGFFSFITCNSIYICFFVGKQLKIYLVARKTLYWLHWEAVYWETMLRHAHLISCSWSVWLLSEKHCLL